jgi:hypothetical protein
MRRTLRTSTLAAAALLLAAACARNSEGTSIPENEALSKLLLGVWCASDDAGRTCWGYDHFVDSEFIEACGVLPETGKPFRAKARYTLQGNETCLTVVESNSPQFYPVGQQFCTRVLKIDDQQQTYKEVDTGKQYTSFRVPITAKVCPGDA